MEIVLLPPICCMLCACSGYMDKLTLNGKCSAEEDTGSRYALCLLKENELHMTPINGALQLRPSFEYLDHFREGERKSKQTVEGAW